MRVEIFSRKQWSDVKHLIDHCQFKDYRYWRLPEDKLNEYVLHRISRSFSDNVKNKIFVASDQGAIVGMAALNTLPWDTDHFGFNMAQLGYLIAEGDGVHSASIKNRLISSILRYCRKEKVVHVSCRVDADDISSVHALENGGFRLVDTVVKYVFNPLKHKLYPIRELGKVRTFQDQDLQILVKIARASFSKDRFHLDPIFPREKADDFHAKWVESFCRGKGDGGVFVAERNNELVGFLAFRVNKELERFTGHRVVGQGLNAVSRKGKGAYPGLVNEIIRLGCNAEFDTQVNNYEVLKIWQRFGFDFVRAQYTFHKKI